MIPKDIDGPWPCTSVVVESNNKLHSNTTGPFRSSWALSLDQVSIEKAYEFQNLLLQIAIANAALGFFGAVVLATVGFEHVEIALVAWVWLICCLAVMVRRRSKICNSYTVTRTQHVFYTDVFVLKFLAGMIISSSLLASATLSVRIAVFTQTFYHSDKNLSAAALEKSLATGILHCILAMSTIGSTVSCSCITIRNFLSSK